MFAYWYLNDLALDLIENEGVRFVRGRTLVGSRVIGAAGMALANSQTPGMLRDIRPTVVPSQRRCAISGCSRPRYYIYCIGKPDRIFDRIYFVRQYFGFAITTYLIVANLKQRPHI